MPIMSVRRLSGTGVHCDHTVHFSADLTLWLNSSGHSETKACPPIPSRLFAVPPGTEVGMDVQTMCMCYLKNG